MVAIKAGGVDSFLARPDTSIRLAVISQMAGTLIVRHVIAVEPLASEPIAEVIARVSVSVQSHLEGRTA